MKKYVPLVVFWAGLLLLLGACTTGPRISDIDADSQINLSGRWNDTDVRKVCDSLVRDLLASAVVDRFIQDYAAKNRGALPAVIVGNFENNTGEHIDTSLISRLIRTPIINSGRLRFVAGGEAREELRAERQDQLGNASEDTTSALANETGAALMLKGEVRAIVNRSGNAEVRSYFVSATLFDIEKDDFIWEGENNDIKRLIERPNVRP